MLSWGTEVGMHVAHCCGFADVQMYTCRLICLSEAVCRLLVGVLPL